MERVAMRVLSLDGRMLVLGSDVGHWCSVGDIKTPETTGNPMSGDYVVVEIDSDEYPMRVWKDDELIWGMP